MTCLPVYALTALVALVVLAAFALGWLARGGEGWTDSDAGGTM